MARRALQESLRQLASSGAGLLCRAPPHTLCAVAESPAASLLSAATVHKALQSKQLHTWQPWVQSVLRNGSSSSSCTTTSSSGSASVRQRLGFQQDRLCWSRQASSSSAPPKPPTSSRMQAFAKQAEHKSSNQMMYLAAIVVGMVGVTYAAVPLYRMFCQATGFGGTVIEGQAVEEKLRRRALSRNEQLEAACAAREITISFNADVDDSLPWRFKPTQRSVKVRPGQSTLAFYTAQNLSSKAITGVSTYNVAPQQVGQYFNKIQCFCFEEQKLRPGEMIDMPVFFYIDPEFALDHRLNGINNITLSYTFFKVAEEEDTEEEMVPSPAGAAAALPLPASAAAVH